jgi:hypothetical protein
MALKSGICENTMVPMMKNQHSAMPIIDRREFEGGTPDGRISSGGSWNCSSIKQCPF